MKAATPRSPETLDDLRAQRNALRDALAFALMEEGRCEHPECNCWRKRAQEALRAAGGGK